MTTSSILILFCFVILGVPGLLASETRSEKSTRKIYFICTTSASIILSLRLAGADSTRYLDVYELCAQGNLQSSLSFVDALTPLLCNLSVHTKYAPISAFIHFFLALIALYLPPLVDKKISAQCSKAFYMYFPLFTSITVLLGYFLSPHRQAAGCILILYWFFSKHKIYLLMAVLFHWSSIFTLAIMIPFFDMKYQDSFNILLKKTILSRYLLNWLYFFLSFMCIMLFTNQEKFLDIFDRIGRYSSMFISYLYGQTSTAQEFGSIFGGFKSIIIVFAALLFAIYVKRAEIKGQIKLYLIGSLALYQFGTIGRIALPAILYITYYLSCNPPSIKPKMLFSALMIVLSLMKAYPTIKQGQVEAVMGWLHPTTARDYYNAYELHYLY